MRKVSIVTLVGANNIGAFMQAFALSKTVEKLGCEVEFLTIPGKKANQSKKEKILRYLKHKNYRLLWYKVKTGKKYTKARNSLPINTFAPEKKYDSVIVGSDEMWNVISKSFQQQPHYFGKGIQAERIISYAPSAGNTTKEDFEKSGMDFSSFNSLSVRDQRTYSLVTQFDSRDVARVLDPTFLLENYDNAVPDMELKKDFILVYSYGMNEDEIRMAKEFSKRVHLPLYSVGTYNRWCKKNIDVTPFEFLAYLKKAKYVITSTFHGTALSIIFNKQFVSCLEHSEKMLSLLKDFKLEGRIVTNEQTITKLMEQEINYENVNQYIEEQREKSMKYLEESLELQSDNS